MATVRTVVANAIRDKRPDLARALVGAPSKTQLAYRIWATFLTTSIEELDESLQDEFRTILIDLAEVESQIKSHLRRALVDEEDEPIAILILQRRQALLLERLDDNDFVVHLAAMHGKVQVIDMCCKFATTEAHRNSIIASRAATGETVLEKAAENGHQKIVDLLVKFDETLLDHGYPLHKAVRGGHVETVKYLLGSKRDLIERLRSGKSALFEERISDKEAESKQINKLLVNNIVRVKSPGMIKKLLQGPEDLNTEICLDLTIFGRQTHKFKPFVEALIRVQPLIKFFPTLFYVQFPYLNPSFYKIPPAIGEEVETVLQWLKDRKGVTEIIELRVPGSDPRAESEEPIQRALSGLSVDVLDWGVLDLSIDILLRGATKNVKCLHLYSSGNWGVLQQWSGAEGVALLHKLERLEITIIKGMLSDACANDYLDRLEGRLKDPNLANLPSSVHVKLSTGPWGGSAFSSSSKTSLESLHETTLTISKLKPFHNYYASCHRESIKNTRVAILDNGIDITLPNISRMIEKGFSFVESFEGRESPWFIASDRHGTQMACLIHELDPFCTFYIAKICEDSTGVDPDVLAKAINWAIKQKVDIISMSVALPKDSQKLQEAVENAKRRDIVMVGSRGDRGNNPERTFPADYPEVISISSLKNSGKQADWSEGNARYFFQGENVSISTEPSYLQPVKHASGSSVATALAAGVASLILSCRRLASEGREIQRLKAVNAVFDRMTLPENDRYVKPWTYFKEKKLGLQDGQQWLEAHFGDHSDLFSQV